MTILPQTFHGAMGLRHKSQVHFAPTLNILVIFYSAVRFFSKLLGIKTGEDESLLTYWSRENYCTKARVFFLLNFFS